MFILKIPKNKPLIEKTIDDMISSKEVLVVDNNFAKRFGRTVKPLRIHGIVGKYVEDQHHETFYKLRISNTKDIIKKTQKNGWGKMVIYNFPIPPKKLLL